MARRAARGASRSDLAGCLRIMVLGLMVLDAVDGWAAPDLHLDLEIRGAAGRPCALCREREDISWPIRPSVQIFADLLVPVVSLGSGALEIGPYVKGAVLDLGGGDVPQVAAGLVVGYRRDRWEFLINGGFGYAAERVGAQRFHPGQTKHTYDLGIWVRYYIQALFISGGYTHNSNGAGLGLNFAQGKGENPGIDQLFLGVGMRF